MRQIITKPSIMYWSIAAHLLLVLCVTTMFSVQVVSADYQLEVRLVNYSNPDHRLRDGGRCDKSNINCDNIFSFEIDVGDGWEQPQETGTYRNNDNIIFGDTLRGGRANPLVFTGVRWSNIRLHVKVCDRDGGSRCQIVFSEVRTIELCKETTPLTVVNSSGGCSCTLQLSYQVICLPDYYGPECSDYCVPRNDSISHYTCNETDGSKICMPGFEGENCTMIQTIDGQEHTQSTSGVGVAVGGAVAGVSVLVVLILLTITAVWVARKKYHKQRVISTDAEEHHYKGADNPIYTSHYNTTNGLTVCQDSSTRELINPIYGSVLQVEDESTISDTKGIESTYSHCGPKVDSITFGNADTGEEYDYVTHGTHTTS